MLKKSGPRNLNPLRITHSSCPGAEKNSAWGLKMMFFFSPPVYISGGPTLPKTNSSPLKMHLSESKGMSPNPSFLRCLVQGGYNLVKWCCGFLVFPLRLGKSEHVSKYSGNAASPVWGWWKKRRPWEWKGHGWSNLLALNLPFCPRQNLPNTASWVVATQIFSIFKPAWRNNPIWRAFFFKWVGSTTH